MIKEIIITCNLITGCQAEEIQEQQEIEPSPEMAEVKEELRTVKKQKRELEKEVKRLQNEIDKLTHQNENDKLTQQKEVSNWNDYEATAYTAYCSTGCTGVTATGVDVRNSIYHKGKRVVAVDPNVIPLGSTVKIRLSNGTTFEATAQDTGGAIKGNKIDILHNTKQEAKQFGRQKVEVAIVK